MAQVPAEAPRLCFGQLDLLAAGGIAGRQLLYVVDDSAVKLLVHAAVQITVCGVLTVCDVLTGSSCLAACGPSCEYD